MKSRGQNIGKAARQGAIAGLLAAAGFVSGCGSMGQSMLAAEPVGAVASADMPAAAAAADAPIAAAGDPASPVGRDWVFAELDGYYGDLPGPPPLPGFILTSEGRRMAGSTACNRMSSAYDLDVATGALRFTLLSNTRRMCGRDAADKEEAVLNALLATDAFGFVDGSLVLLSKGKQVARLTAP